MPPLKTGSKATLNRSNKGSILFAITLKYNPNNLDSVQLRQKYQDYFDVFPYDLLFMNWEKRDKLHLHACFMAPANLTFKSLMMYNYHVYIKPVYNIAGWNAYTGKERNAAYIARRDQKDYEALASTKYLFV